MTSPIPMYYFVHDLLTHDLKEGSNITFEPTDNGWIAHIVGKFDDQEGVERNVNTTVEVNFATRRMIFDAARLPVEEIIPEHAGRSVLHEIIQILLGWNADTLVITPKVQKTLFELYGYQYKNVSYERSGQNLISGKIVTQSQDTIVFEVKYVAGAPVTVTLSLNDEKETVLFDHPRDNDEGFKTLQAIENAIDEWERLRLE